MHRGERVSVVRTRLAGLARDTSSGALLGTDAAAEHSAVLAKRRERRESARLVERLADLERRVAALEASEDAVRK